MTNAKLASVKKAAVRGKEEKVKEQAAAMMNSLKRKDNKSKFFILGGVVIGVILLLVILNVVGGGKGSPDKVIAKYCDIMVNGNYGDLLDIADLPDTPQFSKEKIAEAKPGFREFMEKNNNAVTSCTYTKADEDDEQIVYKLILNKDKTDTVKIKKSNNSVMDIEGVYDNLRIEVDTESVLMIDGEIVPEEYRGSDSDAGTVVYNVPALKNATYDAKATSSLFKDKESDSIKVSSRITTNLTYSTKKENFKNSEDYDAMVKLFKETFPEIVREAAKTGDASNYDKYFVDGNANEVVQAGKVYEYLHAKRTKHIGMGFSNEYLLTFDKWTEATFSNDNPDYIGNNRFKLYRLFMNFEYTATNTTTQKVLEKKEKGSIFFENIVIEKTTEGWKILKANYGL